tara:strand:+ start:217 stop:495 length:279 start_codon:yes stop_codon:yes gene_type:complete
MKIRLEARILEAKGDYCLLVDIEGASSDQPLDPDYAERLKGHQTIKLNNLPHFSLTKYGRIRTYVDVDPSDNIPKPLEIYELESLPTYAPEM